MVDHPIHSVPTVSQYEAEDEDASYVDYFYDEPGSAPGTLSIEPDAPHPVIVLIDFNEVNAIRQELERPEA
ncbi:MAG TPA: magnesium and cobalt transport protein CorA, partial [Coleofasciculaceae cyanobacterium]